jgi:hypothetical protein
MNAQSRRQGDRRPNAKPQTLPSSPAVPSRAAGGLWCEVSSSDLPNRRHEDRTDKPVVPFRASVAASSRPRPPRPPDGLVSATAIRTHSPNRDSAMEPNPARPGSPPAEKGDGCAGRLRLFDQNLSPRLVNRLADLFPDSLHVHSVGSLTGQRQVRRSVRFSPPTAHLPLRFGPVWPVPPARGATPGPPPNEDTRPVRAVLRYGPGNAPPTPAWRKMGFETQRHRGTQRRK